MQRAVCVLQKTATTFSGVPSQSRENQNSQEKMNKPTLSSSSITEVNSKRIDNLFTRFAVFYGHLWRSQFKSKGFLEFAKKEWAEGLSRFSDEILSQAIIECRDFFEMPPSLPQLIGVCRGIKKRNNVFVKPEETFSVNQKFAEESIKKCREFLSKS